MGILEKTIELIGPKGRCTKTALFDSGASYSIIRREIALCLADLDLLPDPEEWTFETAKVGEVVHATHRVNLDFRFQDSAARFSDEFIVFDECSEDVMIGSKTMQAWRIRLDFENDEVVYRKTAQKLRVL